MQEDQVVRLVQGRENPAGKTENIVLVHIPDLNRFFR
jgi:hypothetical protein